MTNNNFFRLSSRTIGLNMRRLFISFLIFLFSFVTFHSFAQDSPKREFRATWFTTHYCIDWPKTRITASAGTAAYTSQQNSQKAELRAILDDLVAHNMNGFCFQARPTSDAFYQSNYEPWSSNLTGTRGKDPGYDPLQYAIEQGHARGLEVHVWINPYRYEVTAGSYGANDPIRRDHPDWLLTYDNGSFSGTILDPGNPAARQYVQTVMEDIISRYDIDGIIFDDYFYPWGGTTNEDAVSVSRYKPADMDVADWRRENVNTTVRMLYNYIQQTKPWVKMGMGPAGTWCSDISVARKYGLDRVVGQGASQPYHTLYCDMVAWMQEGIVEYIAPQIYWATSSYSNVNWAFDKMSDWWSYVTQVMSARQEGGKRIYFYPSAASYRMETWPQSEFVSQLAYARRHNSQYNIGGSGCVLYNTTWYRKDGFPTYLENNLYTSRALPPALSWKAHETLAAPTDLALVNGQLTWVGTAPRYTVYAYPKGLSADEALDCGDFLQGWTELTSFDVNDFEIDNTTFAVCAYDRYGNEFEPAFLNAEEDIEIEEPSTGTFSFSTLWENKTVIPNSHTCRSMSYYNGKLYIPNKDAGEFMVLNAANGNLLNTKSLGNSSFWMHNLRITEDGQMLLGNTGAATRSIMIKTSSLDNGGAAEAATISVSGFGRCDYFYPVGEWNNEGYLLMLSNTSNKMLRYPFNNQELGVYEVIENSVLPSGTSAKAIPANDDYFFASVANKLPTKHLLSTGAKADGFSVNNAPATVSASGMAYFTIADHEFIALPQDVFGSIAIYDITRGMRKATLVGNATAPLGNNTNEAFTIDICTEKNGNTVILYVLAPANGVAAHQFSFVPDNQEEGLEQTEIVNIRVFGNTIEVNCEGQQTMEVYNLMGQLIQYSTFNTQHSFTLPNGAYILRVGNTIQKIIL